MTDITIYTDGSARGNPNGPGGYGALVRFTDAKGNVHEREYSAGYAVTTNNRMELMAAIVALEKLTTPCRVCLYSDSKYLTDAYNEGWIYYWRTHDYKNKSGDAVKNSALWERLAKQTDRHEVTFYWVKGHNGHPENERCDALATAAADGEKLLADDGGDLREEVIAVRASDEYEDAIAGKLPRERMRELMEQLQAEIDRKMELLERLEEAYYKEG